MRTLIKVATVLVVAMIGCPSSALRPEEWVARYTCENYDKTNKTFMQQLMGNKCDLYPEAWRHEYVGELAPKFRLQVKEDSINERLANIIDVSLTNRPVRVNAQAYLSGDREVDARNEQLAAGLKVDDQLCNQHLVQMLSQMDDLRSRHKTKRQKVAANSLALDEKFIYLARVLESFGRYDSGYLSGQNFAIGAYEQCVSSRLLLGSADDNNSTATVDTRYCWAHLNLNKYLSTSLRTRKLGTFEPEIRWIFTAICIPETCHSKSFAQNKKLYQKLINSQFKLPESIYQDENLQVDSIFCLPDDDSEYSSWSLGRTSFVVFLIGWTSVAIVISVILHSGKQQQKQSAGNKIVGAFDLVDSWNDFKGRNDAKYKKRHRKKVELNTLNGIKVICCLLVVYAHASVYSVLMSKNWIQALVEYDTHGIHLIVRSYFSLIDSFFVIAGLLSAYLGIGKIRKYIERSNNRQPNTQTTLLTQSKQLASVWLMMSSRRILRLLPLYVISIWFSRTTLVHLGSGPVWDYGIDRHSFYGMCSTGSLWSIETLFACLPQAWYLFSDLYASVLFVPPLVYLLAAKRTKLAYSLIALITFIFCPAKTLIDFLSLDPGQTYGVRELGTSSMLQYFAEFAHIYMAPIYRVNRVLIGVVAGHMLYDYEINEDKSNSLSKQWFSGPASWLPMAGIVAITLPAGFIDELKVILDPHYKLFPIYQLTFVPIIWSIFSAIIIIRLVTDCKHQSLARLLSSNFMNSMARLMFSIYLIHLHIIEYQLNIVTTIVNFSYLQHISLFATTYLFSVPLAILIFVVLENPIDKLIRAILPL